MKVTKIEKKKRLYLVEIDDSDKLYVTEDTIVRFMMSKGMSLEKKELDDIKTFAQFSYGKDLALYHISFKRRTEKEVKDYLISHDIEQAIIPKILENLKTDKWIDDRAYTSQLIDSNLLSGDKGAYVLKQKLVQKGVSPQLIDELLNSVDFTPVAEKVAQKLLQKYQAKLPYRALKNKINQFLSNKGFTYQEIKQALANLEISTDEDIETDLISREIDKQYQKLSKKYDGYDLKHRLIQTLIRKGYDYNDILSSLRDFL